jgi:hypothetical protein
MSILHALAQHPRSRTIIGVVQKHDMANAAQYRFNGTMPCPIRDLHYLRQHAMGDVGLAECLTKFAHIVIFRRPTQFEH